MFVFERDYLGLSADSEFVLVQQVCELSDVQLQELVQSVDLGEVQLDEVLRCCLQLWTVHAVCQRCDAYAGPRRAQKQRIVQILDEELRHTSLYSAYNQLHMTLLDHQNRMHHKQINEYTE